MYIKKIYKTMIDDIPTLSNEKLLYEYTDTFWDFLDEFTKTTKSEELYLTELEKEILNRMEHGSKKAYK